MRRCSTVLPFAMCQFVVTQGRDWIVPSGDVIFLSDNSTSRFKAPCCTVFKGLGAVTPDWARRDTPTYMGTELINVSACFQAAGKPAKQCVRFLCLQHLILSPLPSRACTAVRACCLELDCFHLSFAKYQVQCTFPVHDPTRLTLRNRMAHKWSQAGAMGPTDTNYYWQLTDGSLTNPAATPQCECERSPALKLQLTLHCPQPY
jgi:hypothetical protein